MFNDRLLDTEHLKPFKLLMLSNIAELSMEQCDQLRKFIEGGGSIVATFETSLYDEAGRRRTDFGLADLFGAHQEEQRQTNSGATLRKWAGETYHTYLRLTPELRRNIDGRWTNLFR